MADDLVQKGGSALLDMLEQFALAPKMEPAETIAIEIGVRVARLYLEGRANETEVAKILGDAERKAQAIANTWTTGG